MNKNFDLIIIGAGSVGVPSAYFLSEKKLKVLCIEKNSAAGQGQNKAAIGGIRATHSDPAKIKICQQSLEIFSNWKEKTGDNIGWKKGGYCFPVYREKEMEILKTTLPIQKKFNLNIEWTDSDTIEKIIPGINKQNLLGGVFSPDDGQASPLLTIEAMQKAAIKNGVVFKFASKVTGFVIKNDKILGIKTTNGDYYAEIILNTAGADAQEIGKLANMNIPVVPNSHEAGISAPIKEFLAPLVVDLQPGTEGKTTNLYFGQNSDNGIIFCYTPKDLFESYDRRSSSEFMSIIAHRLVFLIPKLKNLKIRRVWRGLYPTTSDGIPILGFPAYPAQTGHEVLINCQ